MSKIYCIIGNDFDFITTVKNILSDILNENKVIEIEEKQSEDYNIYLYNYIEAMSDEQYNNLQEKYNDSVIPIYINFAPKESVKSYNSLELKECIKNILEDEFGFYNETDIEKYIKEKEETSETIEQNIPVEASENTKNTKKKGKKKYFFVSIAVILIVAVAITMILNPFKKEGIDIMSSYSKNNIRLYTMNWGGSSYVINSGSSKGFKIESEFCSLTPSLDNKSAIISTSGREIYLIKENDLTKISDNVLYSQISNDGKYAFYITEENGKYILRRYDSSNGNTDILTDDLNAEKNNPVMDIIISPNNKYTAITISESNSFDVSTGNQLVIINNGDIKYYSGAMSVAGISDDGTVYYVNKDNSLCKRVLKNNSYEENLISEHSAGIESVYINSDYTEILYFSYDKSYFYDIKKEKNTTLCDGKIKIMQDNDGRLTRGLNYNTVNTIISKNYYSESNTFFQGLIAVNSFKNLYYYLEKDDSAKIYTIEQNNKLKEIYNYKSNESNGFVLPFSNNMYIYNRADTSITEIEKGNSRIIFDGNKLGAKSIIRISENGAIYYFDENDTICYFRNNEKKEIIRKRIEVGASYTNTHMALDAQNDVLYFVDNNSLYCSESGNKPVIIKENKTHDLMWIEGGKSGILFYEANYIIRGEEASLDLNINVYKVSDKNIDDMILNFESSMGIIHEFVVEYEDQKSIIQNGF